MKKPMNKIVISEYWSDSKDKHAIVSKFHSSYVIDFYENNSYTHTAIQSYQDKSLHYVEDAAENFVLGHFKNYRDFS